MKTTKVVVLIVMALLTFTGCKKVVYVPEVFAMSAYKYDVAEDALPTMDEMKKLQKWANNGKDPLERDVMSLYAKADRNDNGKITKKEAVKTFKEYKEQMEAVLGAIPFKFPTE